MAHQVVDGRYLGTGLDDAPRVRVVTRPGGNPTDLIIEYATLPNGSAKTTITFPSVFEYRWVDGDWDRVWPHSADYEFGLIEIINSEFIERMVDSSPYKRHPSGEKLGGVLKESDVHHYRLGFDDHGLYDVVSLKCIIETTFAN